uniref:Uncharacterized protein n=1 Tax=Oryza nivara TaxID=4536 RepID=A0A0E0J0D5_ORYNI
MAGGRTSARRASAGRDEARSVVKEATTMQGGAAGGCGAVFGARRLASGGRQCSGLAGDERRVKTQPVLGQTDNDGRKPSLGSFESLTDGGGGFLSLLSLETSFRAFIGRSCLCSFVDLRRSATLSGGRFDASLLLDLCVGVVGVWVVVYFFHFLSYDLLKL